MTKHIFFSTLVALTLLFVFAAKVNAADLNICSSHNVTLVVTKGSWEHAGGGSVNVSCPGGGNTCNAQNGTVDGNVSPGQTVNLNACNCEQYDSDGYCLRIGQSPNECIISPTGNINSCPQNEENGGTTTIYAECPEEPTEICTDAGPLNLCSPNVDCPAGQGKSYRIDTCGKTRETQGCHDIPECIASLPTNTPAVPTSTPRPTVTPLPTITTGPGTPTPTPIPTVHTSTPTPIGPTPTGPRPSVTLTPTPTRPANTPTPTITFDKNTCACDGMDKPNIFIGTPTIFTAYSKLTGTQANIGTQKFITFYMYKQDPAKPNETGTLIGGPADVNSVLVSNTTSPTRYRSQWTFTDTSKLEKNVTYMVYADTKKGCVQKTTAYNFETPTQVVLAAETQQVSFFDKIQGFITRLLSGFSSTPQQTTPTPAPTRQPTATPTPAQSGNLKLVPFYPANILEKSCQVLRFQLPS